MIDVRVVDGKFVITVDAKRAIDSMIETGLLDFEVEEGEWVTPKVVNYDVLIEDMAREITQLDDIMQVFISAAEEAIASGSQGIEEEN